MPNPLVSVYILAYNSEKYLDRSLQSLISQTYTNLEILVIINGKSNDNTLRLAESYQLKDNRVCVLTNESDDTSISGGRKFALDNINGIYFTDLDHDDVLPNDAIQTLVEIAIIEKADIVAGKCLFCEDKNIDCAIEQQEYKQQSFSRVEYIEHSIISHDWMMHGKLYASTLYKNNKIIISAGLYSSEDILIHYQLCSFARMVVEINRITYFFIKNQLSSSHNQKLSDLVHAFNTYLFVDNFMTAFHNNHDITCLWRSLRLCFLARDLFQTNGAIYKAHTSEVLKLLNYMDIVDVYNGLPINKKTRTTLKAFKKSYLYGVLMIIVIKLYAAARD